MASMGYFPANWVGAVGRTLGGVRLVVPRIRSLAAMSAIAVLALCSTDSITGRAAAQTSSTTGGVFVDERRLPAAPPQPTPRADPGLEARRKLETEIETLRSQLAAAREARDRAETVRAAAVADTARRKADATAARQQIDDLRKRIELLAAERDRAITARTEIEERLRKGEGQTATAQAEAGTAKGRLKLLESEFSSLKARLDDAQSALASTRMKLAEATAELKAGQAETERLKATAEATRKALAAAEAEQRRLEAALETATSELAAQRKITGDSATALSGLRKRLAAAEAAAKNASARAASLVDAEQRAARERERADAETARAERALRTNEAASAELESRRAIARGQARALNEVRNARAEAEAAREAAEADARKLRQDLDKLRAVLASARSTAAGVQAAKEEQKQETGRLNAKLDLQRRDYEERLRALEGRLSAAEQARRNAEDEQKRLAALLRERVCKDVTARTAPLRGGRVRIAIEARCHANKTVAIAYDAARFRLSLDKAGKRTFVLDLFAGTDTAASVIFPDGHETALSLNSPDADKVAKIALIWNAPVDLDLHAFEYGAGRSSYGHIWAGSPATARDAADEAAASKRGRGFLSFADDGSSPGTHLEAYTFLPVAGRLDGPVRFQLDYTSRGDKPAAPHCGDGKHARVAYTLIRKLPGAEPERRNGTLESAPCGVRIAERARYVPAPIPDLGTSQ